MKEKTLVDQIYTSFEEVTEAYNQVRDELMTLGLLWRCSKLDKVQCIYKRVDPHSALTGPLAYFNENKVDQEARN